MAGEFFTEREKALLGAQYESHYAVAAPLYRGVTVNGLRCPPERFLRHAGLALAPSPFCAQAFLLTDPEQRLGRHAYHHAGVFYAQEPSAAMPAGLLDVRPGERVLDLCAAPGGKSSQLAAALRGEGLLAANEFSASRAAVLRGNLERMGVTNAVILNESTERLAGALPSFFDKVLVDAPCSGEGMFRKEPQALRQHSAALVAQCAALGARILDDAAALVRPGGRLCYSTCTFSPEEDEAQIGAFLARHPEFELLPIEARAGCPGERARCGGYAFPAEYTRRVYPCHGGEGHFMALLQKNGETRRPACAEERAVRAPRAKNARGARDDAKSRAACADFLRTYFPALADHAVETRGEDSFLAAVPEPAQGLRVVRRGVWAGRAAKGRFEPAHQLFAAYGAMCANAERLTLDDPRTDAWLKGEAISARTASAGWTAVLVDGFPLGFGKTSGGTVKNHYPKGLRNL